uniref:Uncharacterized protein n=1 Tax=Arundo donax TaxID=35708 RepID=A0A0A9H0I9_ARUDO
MRYGCSTTRHEE